MMSEHAQMILNALSVKLSGEYAGRERRLTC